MRWILLALTTLALGCSTPRAPAQAVAQAEEAVARADIGESAEHAPLELRLAREKLEEARTRLRDGDYTEARRMAEQALVDVQLAEAKAGSAQARETARTLRESIETIDREAQNVLP